MRPSARVPSHPWPSPPGVIDARGLVAAGFPQLGPTESPRPVSFPQSDLEQLASRGLLRSLRPRAATGGRIAGPDGRTWLNFSSNDYLDLANDSRVKAAASEAVARWGCGATASRLMAGHLELHEELEAALACFLATESALVFGSGFLANLGVLTTLAGPGDHVFADRLNHASLIDGMRLSGARWHRFRHGDAADLERRLAQYRGQGRLVVATDSVFSMDGDIAPLADIATVSRREGAYLIVDEAHALGVQGEGGRGCCHGLPGELRPDFLVGTFSKSLGSYGGFVACRRQFRDLLINRARSFIYSTGLPPASAGAALASLRIIEADGSLAESLRERAAGFAAKLGEAGLRLVSDESQIVAIVVGENGETAERAEELQRRGLLVTAIRPPTVPAGTARLRLSVTLAHGTGDLEEAAAVIAGCVGAEAP